MSIVMEGYNLFCGLLKLFQFFFILLERGIPTLRSVPNNNNNDLKFIFGIYFLWEMRDCKINNNINFILRQQTVQFC